MDMNRRLEKLHRDHVRQNLVLVYRILVFNNSRGTIKTLSDLHFEKITLDIYVKSEFSSHARKLPVHLPYLP